MFFLVPGLRACSKRDAATQLRSYAVYAAKLRLEQLCVFEVSGQKLFAEENVQRICFSPCLSGFLCP